MASSLSLYFKDGRAKLELGIGRGRREFDKRQVIAKRDSDRDAARAMSNVRTGKGERSGRQSNDE